MSQQEPVASDRSTGEELPGVSALMGKMTQPPGGEADVPGDRPIQWDEGLSLEALRDLGIISEVNRQLLHPIGLALSIEMESGNITVHDGREDPEGVRFAPSMLDELAEKAARFREFQVARAPERIAELGYFVQPVSTIRSEPVNTMIVEVLRGDG